jgi:tetratricopeptide (TPR) repeat protein
LEKRKNKKSVTKIFHTYAEAEFYSVRFGGGAIRKISIDGEVDSNKRELSSQLFQNNNTPTYIYTLTITKEKDLSEQAIKVNPQYGDAYINLGNAQKSMNQLDDSKASYMKAYDVAKAKNNDSDNITVLIRASCGLGDYYLSSQTNSNAKEALKWADTCISHVPRAMITRDSNLQEGILGPNQMANSALLTQYETGMLVKVAATFELQGADNAKALLNDFLKTYPESDKGKAMLNNLPQDSAK